MKPILSVVIPHCGRPDDLRRTIADLRDAAFAAEGLGTVEVVVGNVGPAPVVGPCTRPLVVCVARAADPWNAGRARNAGAAEARSDRLFFLDCDVSVPPDFVPNALDLIGPGRAWFPVMRNSHADYNAAAGRRRLWSYGQCGVAAADLASLGGWEELEGWGGEDDLMHWKCHQGGLRVVRGDSGLIHRDHPHDTPWHAQRHGKLERMEEAKRRWLASRASDPAAAGRPAGVAGPARPEP